MRWKIAQWFEKRWWKNYLNNKDDAAYLAWKKDYWAAFLQSNHLPKPVNARILDAGCGPAGIFTSLDQNQVVAIDPLFNFYESEISHFKADDYPWVEFRAQGLESLDDDIPFDYVFCLNVINHVEDLYASFLRLGAHVKPGGKLILSIDCHNFWLPKAIFRVLPFDILHPHQFDLDEYVTMVEKLGFKKQHVTLVKKAFLFNYYSIVFEKA